MSELSFGVKPAQQFTTIDDLRRVWRLADEGGLDGCWTFDHFAPMGPARTGDVFEAWTLIAAMAEATRRIRIGCLVTGNTNRHPAVLAAMAATVDHLAAGRLDFGIGAGYDEYVDAMYGLPLIPARERIARLAEACEVITRLWTEPTATYSGEYYRLDRATADPKPAQRPHPPIWMGSSGERYGLRVVARYADVWMNANMPGADHLAEIRRLSGVLDRHCAEIGRDPATIRRAVQFRPATDPDETLRMVEGYVLAGCTDIIFMVFETGDAAVAATEAAIDLLPKLRAIG